jgi:hypothetical protein
VDASIIFFIGSACFCGAGEGNFCNNFLFYGLILASTWLGLVFVILFASFEEQTVDAWASGAEEGRRNLR